MRDMLTSQNLLSSGYNLITTLVLIRLITTLVLIRLITTLVFIRLITTLVLIRLQQNAFSEDQLKEGFLRFPQESDHPSVSGVRAVYRELVLDIFPWKTIDIPNRKRKTNICNNIHCI